MRNRQNHLCIQTNGSTDKRRHSTCHEIHPLVLKLKAIKYNNNNDCRISKTDVCIYISIYFSKNYFLFYLILFQES